MWDLAQNTSVCGAESNHLSAAIHRLLSLYVLCCVCCYLFILFIYLLIYLLIFVCDYFVSYT